MVGGLTSHGGGHIVPANSMGPQEGHMACGSDPTVSRVAFDNYLWVSEEKTIQKYQGTSQYHFKSEKRFGSLKFLKTAKISFLAIGAIVLI